MISWVNFDNTIVRTGIHIYRKPTPTVLYVKEVSFEVNKAKFKNHQLLINQNVFAQNDPKLMNSLDGFFVNKS